MFSAINFWLLALLVVASCEVIATGSDGAPRLEPILEIRTGGRAALATSSEVQAMARKPDILATAFVAVVAASWPQGLVPVFAIENEDGSYELRRLPPGGMENSSDPLFFALPRTDESNAAAIAGTWAVTATNANRSVHYMTWELGASDARVGGRFDPASEYRVAFVTGGTFQSDLLQLNVQYSNDRYLVSGRRSAGSLNGIFQQEDGSDRGTWVATRASIPSITFAPEFKITPLFEWTRNGSRQKRYFPDGTSPEGDWKKASRALCRVWTRD
jgi:hypothetical protein